MAAMTVLPAAQIVLGLASALASARAAYLWWRASTVEINPLGGELSGEEIIRQGSWLFAMMKTQSESSKLNSQAARWAAIAAALAGAAALLLA